MQHKPTLYVLNGRNYAECNCGWLTLEEDGALTIEDVLSQAQNHKADNPDLEWSCELADYLTGITDHWLNARGIELAELKVDHAHSKEDEPSQIVITLSGAQGAGIELNLGEEE